MELNQPTARKVQFTVRTLFGSATFAAIGMACLRQIGEGTHPVGNACLSEFSAIFFGLAYGKPFGMAPAFAMLFGFFATPIAFHFLLIGY